MNIELNNYEIQTVISTLFQDVRSDIEEGHTATARLHLQTARKFIRLLDEERMKSYTDIVDCMADYLNDQINDQIKGVA